MTTRKTFNDDENNRKEENCYYYEKEEKEEAEEKKTTEKVLLLLLFEREIEKHSARAKALKETVEEETRRNDAMEKNVREREERARREKRAMEKRATKKKKKKVGGVFSSSSVKETEENARRDEDIRELIKIRLKSCEFELRCERSRLFGEVKDVFELESGGERKVRGRNDSISSYGKFLPDVDAFAYSSKQSTQNNKNNNNNNNKEDLDAFIEALLNSSNKKSDDKIENENEIAATLSMMNRFVTLLGKYSFCPSLHRSTPSVTNATEIWKPLDSTTTSSSRNFERGGKESFDDDDDDYARDEAVKVDEFFRKTFGNEDVVLYGDIASPECEILPLYYARAAPLKKGGGVGGEEEEDARAQKKRLLRAVRLLQKSCEIVSAHFAAEVTELVTSDIFDDDAEEDENQYHFTRRLMKELNGNTNNATRGGPFCSLLVAFEALVEIAERKRLQDLYYRSSASSSSSSMSCEELFSSEDDDDDNNKEGFEPVVVISSSLRNIDNTAKSKATMTTKKKNRKSSRKRQLAEKSKSMIKSVWSFVANRRRNSRRI